MEEAFHHNRTEYAPLSVIVRHNDKSMMMERFKSTRFQNILVTIENCSGCCLNLHTFINKKSSRASLAHLDDTLAVLLFDHRYVGGSHFLRMLEAIFDSKQRKLPSSSLIIGIWHLLLSVPYLYDIAFRKSIVSTGKKLFYTKDYTIVTRNNISTRFSVYHTLLNDAFKAFGKKSLMVAFPVPFTGGKVVNNVGLLILNVHKNMNVTQLQSAFQSHKYTALATNTICRIGEHFPIGKNNGGKYIREKVDLIFTTAVVESNFDASVYVKPGGNVFEGAYCFMISRKTNNVVKICASITTNHSNQKWEQCKFENQVAAMPN